MLDSEKCRERLSSILVCLPTQMKRADLVSIFAGEKLFLVFTASLASHQQEEKKEQERLVLYHGYMVLYKGLGGSVG